MLNNTLRKLIDGRYICPVAATDEFEILSDPDMQAQADQWLGMIELKLSRLGSDGAFFASPKALTQADVTRIRDEFVKFRDVYGPAIQMLNLVRHAKDDFGCRMRDVVQLAELMQNVADSATLESQLRNLQVVISGASSKMKNRELLLKLLEHLRSDGYLVLTNPQTETYTVTGKVEQLVLAMQYMAEHEGIIGEDADADDLGDEGDLFEGGDEPQE